MNTDLLGLALTAGMVAAFNPCGFAMLPAYLALVIQREVGGPWAAVGRALVATAAMALGFLTVFGGFGLLTVSVASAVQRHLPYVTVMVGLAMIVAGVWLLSGRSLPGLGWPPLQAISHGARLAPTARLGSMFGYGIGYAIASLSCTIGPFLAVTGSSLRGGSAVGVVAVYAAYAAGIALVVGVLAIAVALAGGTLVGRMRGVLPHINRISGAVLVAVGLYVAYYGWFELRLFAGTGGTDDPVITTAGRIARTLTGWVYQHGVWPWLLSLAALGGLTAAALTWRQRRRPRPGDGRA